MINVKEAVRIALDYLSQLYNTSDFKDVLLEEVELSEDEKWWNITIGFSRPVYSDNPMLASIEKINKIAGTQIKTPYKREYKLFKVAANDGRVGAMKIREV
jgi:hypothetical protein